MICNRRIYGDPSSAKGAKRKEILELRGKVKWEGDLDELRRNRL